VSKAQTKYHAWIKECGLRSCCFFKGFIGDLLFMRILMGNIFYLFEQPVFMTEGIEVELFD
jgi:hypothetical protein